MVTVWMDTLLSGSIFFQSRDDLGISEFSSLLSFSYLSMIVHRLVCHMGANICDCPAYRELCENVKILSVTHCMLQKAN